MHACTHTHMHACTHTHTCSYAEAVDTYESEEELRFLLPLKEYIAYCDSLRYNPHSYLEWRANTIIYKHITLICSLNVCANCICLMKVRIKVLQFLIKFATLKDWWLFASQPHVGIEDYNHVFCCIFNCIATFEEHHWTFVMGMAQKPAPWMHEWKHATESELLHGQFGVHCCCKGPETRLR